MKHQDFPVSIVLATFNGAAHIGAQIQSLQEQDHKAWSVILSDDGSTDKTVEIARNALSATRLSVLQGPQTGLAQNFWNALMHVPTGHFAAFCDQDDVWCLDKLSRALSHLSNVDGPALYSTGRYITNQSLEVTRTQHRRAVRSFARLLLRNQIAGHTNVLNPKAVHILKRFPPPSDVPFHDWWAALVLKGVGAQFIHDREPSLYYRQHTANVLGARGGRLRKIIDGTYFEWVRANHSALLTIQDQLTPDARHALRVCLLQRAGLSLGHTKRRSDHARQHQ